MSKVRKYGLVAFSLFFATSVFMLSYRQRVTIYRADSPSLERKILKNGRTPPTRQERLSQWMKIIEKAESGTRKRRLPDVIGIGVKKCGTGALIHFLGQYPLVKLPEKVETFFFSSFYSRGLKYYKQIMPKVTDDELVMEKTPMYFYDSKKIIERMRKDLPRVKLIVSLCDPVKRAFSDFVHSHYGGHKDDEGSYFADAFDKQVKHFISKFSDESKDYVQRADEAQRSCSQSPQMCLFSNGMYHYNAEKWVHNFNDSQLLVLNGDNWITDPGSLIEQIQKFLGIPTLLLQEDFVRSPETGFYCLNRWWNETFRKPIRKSGERGEDFNDETLFCLGSGKGRTRNGVRTMLPETYEKLRLFYKPHNELLYDLLNKNMGW